MTDYSDSFTGSNGSAWASPWVNARRTGSGSSTIDTNRGKQVSSSNGNYTDYETSRYNGVTFENAVLSGTVTFPTDNEVFGQVWMRADSTIGNPTNGNGYFLSIEPVYNVIHLFRRVNGTQTSLASSVPVTIAANTTYNFKMECAGTTIRGKLWTGTEPDWMTSATDSSHASGYAGLSIDGGLAASVAWRADWDNWLLSTPTPALTFTGSVSSSGTVVKSLGRIFLANVTSSGVYSGLKVVTRLFLAQIAPAGAFAKYAIKRFTGSMPSSGIAIKSLARWFTGGVSSSGVFWKAPIRVFTGAVAPAGAFILTLLGKVFGRPGILTMLPRKAGELIMRIRRE